MDVNCATVTNRFTQATTSLSMPRNSELYIDTSWSDTKAVVRAKGHLQEELGGALRATGDGCEEEAARTDGL